MNSVEVGAQEACYLLLQMQLTKASRDVEFINTSPPEDRTFLLKDREALEQLPENSTDIGASNMIKLYCRRPRKYLDQWCLADFVSKLAITSPKQEEKDTVEQNDDQSEDSQNSDTDSDTDESDDFKRFVHRGVTYRKRKNPKVIRYVKYSKDKDLENYCRERLLLFTQWRNEETDIKGPYNTYADAYYAIKSAVDKKAAEYEHNADVLAAAAQAAIDEECEAYDELAPGTEQVAVSYTHLTLPTKRIV